ncbi:MAG: ABC transporter substrate-binding protein [Burkholderiales bacterium]|jgi:ABC-type nitrate/sulfonate/bicarbonate transport system substrate-binding protein|nr:ABC transporter substrate-binding protein [Microcystis sp. M020S1]MCA3176557.1 ABC transporter substrate-binding protein [Burkholderiales bacterium]
MSKLLDTLWYTRCPVPTSLGIAVQKGWLSEAFSQQCTKVESLRESNDKAIRESHFDHTLKNSVRHGGNIPAIWARAIGRETRVLGLSWSDEQQLILTRSDTGIKSPKDLKGRKFGVPHWRNVQIDFSRAQAIRGLENALKLEGLSVKDVELINFTIDAGHSDEPAHRIAGTTLFSGSNRPGGRNAELLALLRGEVDAIFLKGASASHWAHAFNLVTVIDTGAHPDPLIRANNGTPRTLTVDKNLLDFHFEESVLIVEQVLRAEQWATQNPEEARRYLARETNSSEYWVTVAYGNNAHERLTTDLSEASILGLQDFTDFLARWEFIPNSFDVRTWIDPRPLQQAQKNFKLFNASPSVVVQDEAIA